MALTAQPQSALANSRDWDSTIVPALRKRLESESRVLSNRLSRSSMDEEFSPPASQSHQTPYGSSNINARQATSGPARRAQQSYDSTQSAADSVARFASGPITSNGRTRTKSQTLVNDLTSASRSQVNLTSSRSASPAATTVLGRLSVDVKPSRIPTPARHRTTSTSTHSHQTNGMVRSESRNGSQAALRDLSLETDLPPQETRRPTAYATPVRPSMDEERPFEHWYRGETSRNGGVGEMRVGKREEMLEIANFGHPLRPAQPGATAAQPRARRRRADSLGARESFYLEEDASAARVLDEEPLTDLDDDADMESDHASPYEGNNTIISQDDEPVGPVDRQRSPPPTRIPPPQISPRHVLDEYPTPIPRAGSEPPPASAPSRPNARSTKSAVKTVGQPPSPTDKRGRTKNPATTNKRAKTESSLTTQKRSKSQGDIIRDTFRGSIAMYPSADGMAEDAIPTWTQPVPPNGNWDEVVLPTVARKKGLSDYYEQGDGSPQPRRTREEVIEPAPGTFGYDHSKYRFRPTMETSVELAEFGQSPPRQQRSEPPPETESPADKSDGLSPPAEQSRRRPASPREPAPFSHYEVRPKDSRHGTTKQKPPEIIVTQPTFEQQQGGMQPENKKDEEHGAGCCKCVVM